MRVAICDDEERFAVELKQILDTLCFEADLCVDTFNDGISLELSYKKNPYDVVFLDIEMEGINGIEVAERIRKINEETYIIFVTSHVEYAIKGYEVNALRYLTKPVKQEKVLEVMRYIIDKKKNSRTISIRCEGESLLIEVSKILYIEAMDKYVKIYTEHDEYLVRSNLTEFEEKLKDYFVRIHRCFLVNPGKVFKYTKDKVTMTDKKELPMARGKEKCLKEALFSFVDREAF